MLEKIVKLLESLTSLVEKLTDQLGDEAPKKPKKETAAQKKKREAAEQKADEEEIDFDAKRTELGALARKIKKACEGDLSEVKKCLKAVGAERITAVPDDKVLDLEAMMLEALENSEI